MTQPQTLRLYRITRSNPPDLADFSSKAQLQIPCPVPDPDIRRRWTGLSLFGTESQARRAATRFPMLGSYIAALDLPSGPGGPVEGTAWAGHFVLSGASGGTSIPDPTPPAPPEPVDGLQFEIWELRSCSLVASYDSEERALTLVRRLLDAGWSADDLVMGAEDPKIDVGDLPPTLTGVALAARATSG
jgi:hypothetical protein